MPFWSRKDNSDRDDKPKNRETGINDAYPLEKIGSPQFLERVEKLTPVLAHEINMTAWFNEIDRSSSPQLYLLGLTKVLYRVLTHDESGNPPHQQAQFVSLEPFGTLAGTELKAYLQLKPKFLRDTESIALDLQNELLKKVKVIHGKFDANPTSSRRERIIFYFDANDRTLVLSTLAEKAREYVLDPGKLRDVSPSVIPGLNYAAESNVAWNSFIQQCIPDQLKIEHSYRYVLAFFCAVELTGILLTQYGEGNGPQDKSKVAKVERYISTIKASIEQYPDNPPQVLLRIATVLHQSRF